MRNSKERSPQAKGPHNSDIGFPSRARGGDRRASLAVLEKTADLQVLAIALQAMKSRPEWDWRPSRDMHGVVALERALLKEEEKKRKALGGRGQRSVWSPLESTTLPAPGVRRSVGLSHRDAGRLVARSKKPATGVSLGGGLRLYREIRYGTPSDPLPPGTGKPTVVYAIRSRAPQSWWKRTGEERTDPESRGDRYPRQQYQFQKFWIPHEWPLVEIWPNRWVIRGRAGILRRGKASGSRGTPHGLPASQYTPLTLIRPKRHFFESDVRPPVGQVGPAPTRLIAVSRQKHLNPRVAGAYRPPDWAFWELRVGSGGHPSERGYQKPAENCDVVAITVNQYGVPTAVRCETAADVVKGQLEWDSYWAHSGAMD